MARRRQRRNVRQVQWAALSAGAQCRSDGKESDYNRAQPKNDAHVGTRIK
jgi:hypothetical protein